MSAKGKPGVDYCKACKSDDLFDCEVDGEYVTVCMVCSRIQQSKGYAK